MVYHVTLGSEDLHQFGVLQRRETQGQRCPWRMFKSNKGSGTCFLHNLKSNNLAQAPSLTYKSPSITKTNVRSIQHAATSSNSQAMKLHLAYDMSIPTVELHPESDSSPRLLRILDKLQKIGVLEIVAYEVIEKYLALLLIGFRIPRRLPEFLWSRSSLVSANKLVNSI